jgi:hypothetical protein
MRNVDNNNGKWPSEIKRTVSGGELLIEFKDKPGKKHNLRLLDPWALAELVNNKGPIDVIRFKLDATVKGSPEYVAFKRRVSYLKMNNPVGISIEIDGDKLLSESELFVRPQNEIVQPKVNRRKSKGVKEGRLEKDFQDWLYNSSGNHNNYRLAVFGEDFYKTKKKNFKLVREFPTGAFDKTVSEEGRILPTNFIDFVTRNKYGELSIIELKINDPKLEVISQALDYALYFRIYAEPLNKILMAEYNFQFDKGEVFNCYIVNNHYHPRFNEVFKYYMPKDEKVMKFRFKKITLGYAGG